MLTFPHYTQQESADCGPACLRMIAKYYGKNYSAEMLRKHCYISREGVSMLGISDAAEYIGFHTLGVRITFEQLAEEAALPCILHWNQNHFVVCYGIRKKRFSKGYKIYVSDPASQRLRYDEEEFKRCWISTRTAGKDCGMALMLEPGADFGKREEELEEAGKSLTSFVSYLTPHRGLFMQILAGMALGSVLQLAFPLLTQAMVDVGIGGKDMGVITLILIAQMMLFAAQLSVGYMRGWIMLHINSRIDIALISDFLVKLTSMPLHFFDTRKTGDIMQRIGDHGRIKSFLMGSSVNIMFSTVNFIIFTAVLAYYDLRVLAVFAAGNTLYVAWVLYFMRYRRELDAKRFNLSSTEQSRVIQLIQGMQDIKLNNCERQKRWEWERIQVRLFKVSVKGMTIGQVQGTGAAFFTRSTNILISFIAAKAVVEGRMTLGMMMSLTYIIGQISAPINDLIGFAHALQDARISLERLNEIHAQEDEESGIHGKMQSLPEDRGIEIKGLTYSYSGADRDYAIEDISLSIPAGKVTAIVGESGSGKTTLIKLMQGFYRPNKGSIRVGGVNLEDINPHLWRRMTGSVMQESFIFSDTIANNIALCEERADLKRLQDAAAMANADEFIRDMPMGYNTRIGMEGCGVSQGQRQRLIIARAIYKNPEYMFFDEATNSLDSTNEKTIMDNLRRFYEGKTVVIAAHRLSTVMGADQIIVMRRGKIVERGTHAELVERKGHYYTLVRNQLELGL